MTTIVGFRRANIGRDYGQADRIDLLVQVVAYRDDSAMASLMRSSFPTFMFCAKIALSYVCPSSADIHWISEVAVPRLSIWRRIQIKRQNRI